MAKKSNLLEFIGGPLDGFSQTFSATLDELPNAVAIPLNAAAGRIFGLRRGMCHTKTVAIYELNRQEQVARYAFRYEQVREQVPARCTRP